MNGTRRAAGLGILALVLLSGSAAALPAPGLESVALGDRWDTVWAKFAGSTNVRTFSATEYQGFASGLLRTDLLAALNRARATHTLFRKSDTRRVRFLVAGPEDSLLVLAFAEDRLEAAFWRTVKTPTPGGADRHQPAHLSAIHQTLDRYRQTCGAQSCDARGRNHFRFKGSCGGVPLYLEYLPALDQIWVLFHR